MLLFTPATPSRNPLRPIGTWSLMVLLLSLFLFLTGCSTRSSSTVPPLLWPVTDLPLAFVPNQGQSDDTVLYQAQNGYNRLEFTGDGLALSGRTVWHARFVGGNKKVNLAAADPLPGTVNYLIGPDPTTWYTRLPTYATLHYPELYPGIQLTFMGQPQALSAMFTVQPGADVGQIQWQYDTPINQNADQITLTITPPGQTPLTTTAQVAPLAWQTVADETITIPVHFRLSAENTLALAIGEYDPDQPLTVVLQIPLLWPGDFDEARGLAVDNAGYAYVTGDTRSSAFPVINGVQSELQGSEDAFVTKINLDGSDLVYSTYLGGSDWEMAEDIVVDDSGRVTLIGATSSTNFPVMNPLQPALAGTNDLFVSQLSADGSSLLYSTYLGGSESEYGWAIAQDQTGNVYIAGDTWSADFPVVNPFQATRQGAQDAFVSQIAAAGTSLIYSTYLGGADAEWAYGLALDNAHHVYVTGSTYSPNFPLLNPWQSTLASGSDAFVSKFTSAGNALQFSSYLGGSDMDAGVGIAVDEALHFTVLGVTYSTDFPTVNPLQAALGGNGDMFVTRLTTNGTTIVYSTYLGGSGGDSASDIAVNSQGDAYLTGYTGSGNYPLANALQSTLGGPWDPVITGIAADGTELLYSTYLGGHDWDVGYALDMDGAGNVYVAGLTRSVDFPTTPSAWHATYAGNMDAFVAKVAADGSALAYSTYLGGGEPYPGPTDVTISAVSGESTPFRYLLFGLVGFLLLAVIWGWRQYQKRQEMCFK